MERDYDIVIVGSGAGGGTVAQELAPLVEHGRRVVVLEKGPRLADHEFTGVELEMAQALYEQGGGFLTHDGTMTLAFAISSSWPVNSWSPSRGPFSSRRIRTPSRTRDASSCATVPPPAPEPMMTMS